jgi:hypothetical protein
MSAKRKNARKAPPAPSLAAQSRATGITRETLRRWRSEGVDIDNPKQLAARIEAMRKNTAPGSLSDAKLRKTLLECERLQNSIDRENGKVIDLAEVEAAFTRVGAEVKGRLLSMRADLVNELVGKDEAGIYKVLDDRFHELLAGLYALSKIPKQ